MNLFGQGGNNRLLLQLGYLQGSGTLAMVGLWWWLGGQAAAAAALAGGFSVMVPALLAGAVALGRSPGTSAKQRLGALYRAEAVKIGVTLGLLIVLVPVFAETSVPLLTTYVVVIFLYWPALLTSARMDTAEG